MVDYKSVDRKCEVCDGPLVMRNSRDITRKRFCSNKCHGHAMSVARGKEEKTCRVCGNTFRSYNSNGSLCSKDCVNTYTLEKAYARMNDNPSEYFRHALYKKGRGALTVSFMLDLLEAQGGLCAISGQKLTFIKVPGGGRINTNASIDQIVAGGGYTEDNVQIVCDVVNRMKIDMTQKELEFWCRAILEG